MKNNALEPKSYVFEGIKVELAWIEFLMEIGPVGFHVIGVLFRNIILHGLRSWGFEPTRRSFVNRWNPWNLDKRALNN